MCGLGSLLVLHWYVARHLLVQCGSRCGAAFHFGEVPPANTVGCCRLCLTVLWITSGARWKAWFSLMGRGSDQLSGLEMWSGGVVAAVGGIGVVVTWWLLLVVGGGWD